MRAYNWTQLPNTKIKDTIWENTKDEKIVLDVQTIEDLFGVDNTPKPEIENKPKPKKFDKPVKISLLIPQKANNIEILLKGLKKEPSYIKGALEKMREEDLTPDELQALSGYIPDPEEMKLLKEFDGDPTQLGNAELYYMEIMQVPNLSLRINTLLYKFSFAETVAILKTKLEYFSSAIDFIMNDKRFFTFLEVILAMGNYVNGDTRRGGTWGFKLSSLRSLTEVKSFKNNNLTLLHYLVEYLQKNKKEILDLFLEFEDIHNISKDNLEDIAQAVNKLVAGIKPIETALKGDNVDKYFKKTIGGWLSDANSQLTELSTVSQKVQENYKELLNYYAEAPVTKSDQFFSTLSLFAKDVDKSLVELVKIREEEEKEKKRQIEEDKRTTKTSNRRMPVPGPGPQMGVPSQGQLDMILQQMKKGQGLRRTTINKETN